MLRLKWNNLMTTNLGIIYMIEACRLDADREVQVLGVETAETKCTRKVSNT